VLINGLDQTSLSGGEHHALPALFDRVLSCTGVVLDNVVLRASGFVGEIPIGTTLQFAMSSGCVSSDHRAHFDTHISDKLSGLWTRRLRRCRC